MSGVIARGFNGRDGDGLRPCPPHCLPRRRPAARGVSWRAEAAVRRAQAAAGCTREVSESCAAYWGCTVTAAGPGQAHFTGYRVFRSRRTGTLARTIAAVPYASVPTHQCMCPVPILQVVGGPNCQLVDVLDACARAARSLAKEVSVGDAVARGPVSTVRPTRQSSRPAPVMYQQTACYQNNTRHNSEAMLNRQINSIYFVFIDSIGTG